MNLFFKDLILAHFIRVVAYLRFQWLSQKACVHSMFLLPLHHPSQSQVLRLLTFLHVHCDLMPGDAAWACNGQPSMKEMVVFITGK